MVAVLVVVVALVFLTLAVLAIRWAARPVPLPAPSPWRYPDTEAMQQCNDVMARASLRIDPWPDLELPTLVERAKQTERARTEALQRP